MTRTGFAIAASALLFGAAGVFVGGCGPSSPSPTSPPPAAGSGTPAPPVNPGGVPHLLVGAGDIGDCTQPGSELTAQLLDTLGGTVFTAGDNAYPTGDEAHLRKCYDPTWGRHKARTRPTPGNHEYEVRGAGPYYAYFSTSAGPAGQGYYSYAVGAWRILAINSEVPVGGGSAQLAWVRGELSATSAKCTAAIMHRPRYSSGKHGDNMDIVDLWRTFHELNLDVVVGAHDHHYERFAPMDADGRADAARGIRQFLVGTGGAAIVPALRTRPNSEVKGASWGVLVLTLTDGAYSWEFVPVDGQTFRDAGTGSCH